MKKILIFALGVVSCMVAILALSTYPVIAITEITCPDPMTILAKELSVKVCYECEVTGDEGPYSTSYNILPCSDFFIGSYLIEFTVYDVIGGPYVTYFTIDVIPAACAHIYNTDSTNALGVQYLLQNIGGYPTDIISTDDLLGKDLSIYDLISIGYDTASDWSDTSLVTHLTNQVITPGKPVLGIGQGGYAFYDKIGLSIGEGAAVNPNPDGLFKDIIVNMPGHPLFNNPYDLPVGFGDTLTLYNLLSLIPYPYGPTQYLDNFCFSTMESGINWLALSPLNPKGVILEEDGKYIFWGFSNVLSGASYLTSIGGPLFINAANSLLPDNDDDGVWDGADDDDDNDGMPDDWEIANDLDPLVDDSGSDPDGDGLTNIEEFNAGTNPQDPDTDGDGRSDDREIARGRNPNDPLDYEGIPDNEWSALEDLFNYTNGPGWENNENWLDISVSAEDWFGISLDLSGDHVEQINLGYNMLLGQIPASIGNLTHLRSLRLGPSRLSGSIPVEIGNLTNLFYLNLHYSQLTGPIPSELGNLTNLYVLQLDRNELSGSIPAELGNLTDLQSLHLFENQLSGSIPLELGNLSNLHSLALNENQLSGPIPAELGNLNNLQSLHLYRNQLSGSIPVEIGNLTNLEFLLLHWNELSGPIPVEMENLSNLQWLIIYRNQLSGSIPSGLGNLTNLQRLNIGPNQLSGTIPKELGNLINLQQLHIQLNQLSGDIPSELGNLINLQELVLSSNQLSDSIPEELGNLVNLQWLVLSGNQLSGTIPSELGNLTNLTRLFLAGNQLSGTIPSTLGNLTNLTLLFLGGNMLEGPLPMTLSSLNSLTNGACDFGYNALYTSSPGLRDFLNSKQSGGDWEGTQTIAPSDLAATISSPVELTWSTIAYTVDNGGYEIFYSFAAGDDYTKCGETANKSEDSIILPSLPPPPPGGTYFFKVRTKTEPHFDNQNTVFSPFTYPVVADQDWDEVPDNLDNCHTFNPKQENWDGDLFGDACDNCPHVANDDQIDSDGDSLGDACENIDQSNQGPSGTIPPGDLIYRRSCYQNNTASTIAIIKRDCFNTFFEIRDKNNNLVGPPRYNIGPAYGIPNDVIYLPPGGQDCVWCEITGSFNPGTLIDQDPSDGSPEIYTIEACSSHYISDPDLLPNGTCLSQPCVYIFNGMVCSTPGTISIEGNPLTHVTAILSFIPNVWSPDDFQPVSAQISSIEGYTVNEVDTGTILFNGEVSSTSSSIVDGVLTVQFNASDVWQSLGSVVPGSIVYPKVHGRVGTNDLFVAQSRVEIACPDIDTVTYDGDAILFTEGAPEVMANLVATLRNEQGNVMDINYIDYDVVTFTLTADGVDDIVVQAGLVDGIATVNLELGPAVYWIKTEYACSSLTVVREAVLIVTDEGFATGGGWIVPEDDGLNTHPGARANFGFNAKYKKDNPTGHLKFRYSDGYIDLKSTSIEQLVVTGGKIVQFKGWARANGEEGYWFLTEAIDNGKPGRGVDVFDLRIWAPGESPEEAPSERAHGLLKGGNIVVHSK